MTGESQCCRNQSGWVEAFDDYVVDAPYDRRVVAAAGLGDRCGAGGASSPRSRVAAKRGFRRGPAPAQHLWIMADQFRYDCLGANGNSIIRTPNLDRLAGSRPTSPCLRAGAGLRSSRASFFTGRYRTAIATA